MTIESHLASLKAKLADAYLALEQAQAQTQKHHQHLQACEFQKVAAEAAVAAVQQLQEEPKPLAPVLAHPSSVEQQG